MFLKLLLYCLENERHILLLVLAIENTCFGIFQLSIIVKISKNLQRGKNGKNRVMNFENNEYIDNRRNSNINFLLKPKQG